MLDRLRDPESVYIASERQRLLDAQACRELVIEIFRLAIRDAIDRRSPRKVAAFRFLRSSWAAHLADLLGLESMALEREARRLEIENRTSRTSRRCGNR